MQFTCKLLDQEGKKHKEKIQAESRKEAIEKVKKEGYLILDIEKDFDLFSFPLFTYRELRTFSREAYFLLSNGMELIDVFAFMEDKAKKKKQKDFFKHLVDDLYQGRDLGESLKNQDLPSFFVASLSIAKESNSLAESFRILADHYEKQEKIRQSLKLALIYPCILCLSMIFMTQFISIYVLPIFEDLFQQRSLSLPWYTRLLFFLTGIQRKYFFLWGLVLILGIFLAFRIKERGLFRGKFRQHLYRIPLLADFMKTRLSMDFSRHLYLLLSSGTDLLQGLSILARSSQYAFDQKIYEKIEEDLIQGKALWKILDENDLFLKSLPAILRTSDYGAPLVDVFEHTSSLYQEDYMSLCKKLNALFEPVILLFISCLVAFVVLSIASPMFDLMNQI